jgi:predicted dehydrogenase
MSARKRYAIVGLGGRHRMFRQAITETYTETAELVALCDLNPGRVDLAQTEAAEEGSPDVPGFAADDFDAMIEQTRPDAVVVTVRDCFHDEYICRAMEAGCDVITEKPMTTDEQKCRRILDTQKKTGQRCTVSFNYRYSPPRSQIKKMLMEGVIGNVLSVDFQWMLNIRHGADYYRRWHRNKVNSGGLMVHKATHHFDLVNWWLSTVPTRVQASGGRQFYTPQTGDRYGLANRSDRCHTCPEIDRCPFSLKLAENETLKALYLDNEQHDGYYRDRCVWSGDIDIEDTMNVLVDYATGARLCYSLNSFMPWEGFLISFNGTKGRIEHKCQESVYVNGDGSVPGELQAEGSWTRVYPHFDPAYEVDLWTGTGGHGGGDPVMLADIFEAKNQPADPYLRAADQRGGAFSILTGIAANHSMAENRPVTIEELVGQVDSPDYPAMPTADEPLPLGESPFQ